MCISLNINNINHIQRAASSTIDFIKILRGKTQYKKECDLLDMYNIGIQPDYTRNIKKNIAKLKWVIYINNKNNKITNDIVNIIALLGGLCQYFNELDIINQRINSIIDINTNATNNNSINTMIGITEQDRFKYLNEITNKYTVNDIL